MNCGLNKPAGVYPNTHYTAYPQDLDGKYRVERVHIVELPSSTTEVGEDAPLVEDSDVDETVLLMPQTQTIKFFEHRHLR